MKCLFCNTDDTQVIDTRLSEDKIIIKRRRRCVNCDKRFNTLEKVELQMPAVIKSGGTRQEYEENKLGKLSIIHGDPVFTNILINHFGKIKLIQLKSKK